MNALVEYLGQLLTQRGHFNIDDELAVGNIERIRKLLRNATKNVRQFDVPTPRAKDVEKIDHSAPIFDDLDQGLTERLTTDARLLKAYEELWNPNLRALAKGRQGGKRQEFHLELFRKRMEGDLRQTFSSLDIDGLTNICYVDEGKVVFPKNFLDFINTIESLNLHKSELFFRGHSNSSYRLIPSIYRGTAAFFEKEMLYDTINLLPDEVRNAKSNFEVLTKLQHFGAPTRLLDLTTNPLVGLYFACTSKSKNGEVLCFNVDKTHIKLFDSDTVSVLSNLAKMPFDFNIRGMKGLSTNDFNKQKIVRELVHKIRSEKSYFENIIEASDLEKSFFVTSKLDNPRIIRQSGAFIICGMNDAKLSPSPEIFEFERNVSKRVIISRSIKNEIRKSLDIFNISSGSLFPDLSEVSRYIRSKYYL